MSKFIRSRGYSDGYGRHTEEDLTTEKIRSKKYYKEDTDSYIQERKKSYRHRYR